MFSLSLGLWQNVAALSTGSSTPTATVTMTQLASAKRVYQRSTTSGGGQSNGQGSIPVAFSAVTQAGTIHARCSSGGGTRGDLQAEFAAATIGSTGAQTVTLSGIDARLGWFQLDILDSSGTWQNGTVLVGMGRVIAASGQSLATRMFRVQDASVTATNASLSVSINANSSVYATYTDNNTLGTAAWAVPADSSNYDSTFASEYLNRVVGAAGVNCALVGHSRGAQSITAFLSGGTEVAALRSRLDEVGGFEAFIWMQGHSDSVAGMSGATYQTNLSTLFTDMASHNVARGSSFEKYLATIPNINSTSWGTVGQVNAIRTAARAWAAGNSGVSVEPMDLSLVSDLGVHQDQTGNITLAGHFYRASRPSLGLSHSDAGPLFGTPTRSAGSASISIPITFPSGGTALSGVGTPKNRFIVAGPGGRTGIGVTTFTVGATSLTILLSSTPANNAPLDISVGYAFETVNNGAADMIYDNGTDGDGISTGRGIGPTYSTPCVVAAPSPSLGPTLTSHSVTYGSSASGFGTQMTAGWAEAAAVLGDDVAPYSETKTVQGFWTPNSVASVFVLFSAGGLWVGTTAAGKMQIDTNGSSGVGTTTLVAGTRYHWRAVCGQVSTTLSLGVAGGSAAVEITCGGHTPAAAVAAIGAFAGGGFNADGKIDEVATFYTQLATAYTVPTAPLVGNEAGLYSLYHLDSALTSG